MPPNTVKVDRTTRFGNPYWDVKRYGLDICLRLFENSAQGIWDPSAIPPGSPDQWWDWLYRDHELMSQRLRPHPIEAIRRNLAGKNLACWCGPNARCHADILLRIANT